MTFGEVVARDPKYATARSEILGVLPLVFRKRSAQAIAESLDQMSADELRAVMEAIGRFLEKCSAVREQHNATRRTGKLIGRPRDFVPPQLDALVAAFWRTIHPCRRDAGLFFDDDTTTAIAAFIVKLEPFALAPWSEGVKQKLRKDLRAYLASEREILRFAIRAINGRD